ncbi:MAG: TerC family protein [Rhodobacteraceae bacterium]|nr:TerC family protein [Paracoccaceae bacterium]
MPELLSDPAVWLSFATLAVLEIVLGIDNVIFISIAATRLPEAQRRTARLVGLSGALVMRVALLFSITFIMGLTYPVLTLPWFGEAGSIAMSWRDIILLAGGLFLIWKASTEIFAEVEGETHGPSGAIRTTLAAVIVQIMILDLLFSLDSVITAVGMTNHIEVMIAAVVVAIAIMMLAAEPLGNFVAGHPSTKMLALAFLVMVGMALVADGLHYHIERAFIYAAMVFAGAVEALNLWRQKRRREAAGGH